MSSKESHKDIKQSNKKSKTQRLVFLEKSNMIALKTEFKFNSEFIELALLSSFVDFL